MRNRIDFWLDNTRADDKRVLKRIQTLKSKKSFRKTVMDGIMVMSQLAKGDTTLLFKLHPWIIDKVLASAPAPAAPPAPDTGDLEARIGERIDAALNEALLHAPALPATDLHAAPLKPLPSVAAHGTIGKDKVVSEPVFDDDDQDTLIITKTEAPQMTIIDLVLSLSGDGMLGGKNYTAEANNKSLANRRMS